MTPVEEKECIRGVNVRGNTQPAARGNGQFDIGELPALVDFTTHVLLSYVAMEFIPYPKQHNGGFSQNGY